LTYFDPNTNKRTIPEVIEPSVGLDRLFYAIICDKYSIEKVNDEEREVLHLPFNLAPYKVSVLPLANKLSAQSEEIFNMLLNNNISSNYDSSGSIGKRYRRADAIGTPFCVTIDFDTEKDGCVTIRNRDSMKQERIKIENILNFIKK
jgi:glycyl-tRNA synthetase